MKHSRLKGFTLVECIIAMFILALSTLIFVQMYGTAASITKKNRILHQKFDAQMSTVAEETTYDDSTAATDRNAYLAKDRTFTLKYSSINSDSKNITCSIQSDLYEVKLDRFGHRPSDADYDTEDTDNYNYSYYHTEFIPYTEETTP